MGIEGLNFEGLMSAAARAMSYITEGQKLAKELFANYETAKDTLSDSDKATLEAKLAEVEAASSKVHTDIQSQE